MIYYDLYQHTMPVTPTTSKQRNKIRLKKQQNNNKTLGLILSLLNLLHLFIDSHFFCCCWNPNVMALDSDLAFT